MLDKKIANKEAVAVILTIVINFIILNSNKLIIRDCKSSAILNCVFISIIAIILVLIICKLFKNFPGQSLLDISNYIGGPFLKFIIGIIYTVYFILISSILLRRLCNSLQTIFFPLTEIIFIFLLFIISAALVSQLGKSGAFKANLIISPLIYLVLILVFIGNTKNFNFNNIYPILGQNIDATFFKGFSNLFAFIGLGYLYFIPSYLSDPNKFKNIALYSCIISGLFLILIVSTVLFMFNNTLSNSELFPLYLAVRYIEFGTFFQRLDSFFLFIVSLAFISYLSISTIICTNILKKISNTTNNEPVIYPYLLCIFSTSILIKNNPTLEFFENDIFKILFFSITLALSFIILILANIKKKQVGGNN